jgi:hypothetical protein
LAALVFVSLVFLGCGSKTVPIQGKVKFKDGSDVNVLAGYEVNMQAEGGGASSYGAIQPDGTFEISTFGQDDGALPGTHKVTITPPASPDPDKPPAKPAIPAKYGSFETSGLAVEVKPGQGAVELELERTR